MVKTFWYNKCSRFLLFQFCYRCLYTSWLTDQSH